MKDFFGYKVYRDGSIINKCNRKLKPRNNGFGYRKVGLTINGKYKSFMVHRLVAMCYIENPENKPQVNHINGIKTDNRVENLEWVTQSENMRHADKTGLRLMPRGEVNLNSKLKMSDAGLIRELYYSGLYTQKQLADLFSVSNQLVSRIVNNKSYPSKDYNIKKVKRNPEKNVSSKLTWKEVNAIRDAYRLCPSINKHSLARAYGVSERQIRDIINMKYWTV